MIKRTVLITGAANGIGLAIAKLFVAEDYQVAMCDLPSDKLNQEVALLNKNSLRAIGIPCDICNEEQIIQAIDLTIQSFARIDILINNAGLQFIAPIEEFPTEKFEQLLRVMLIGPFLSIKHIFPIMKRQNYGRIINMASINGLVGFAGKSAYNSAKHGLIGLTKVAALEGAADNITVNAICPGYVNSELVNNQLADLAKLQGSRKEDVLEDVIFPLVPSKRLIDVQEIARYVLFIAGEGALSVTGQAIVIDGGYTAQ